jgi:hypothetical protein
MKSLDKFYKIEIIGIPLRLNPIFDGSLEHRKIRDRKNFSPVPGTEKENRMEETAWVH